MSLIPIFASFAIIVSGITCLMLGTQGMFINRTFLNMPLTVLENSVIDKSKVETAMEVLRYDDLLTFDELKVEEEKNFYFDKELVKQNVNEYLKLNLKDKISSYQIAFKFYEKEDGSFIESSILEPTGVLIRFRCNYYESFQIDSEMSFYIEEKEMGSYE